MKTTFEPPAELIPGRIAHVVYRVVGQADERSVTSGVDENVSDAVKRDLFVATGVPIVRINVVVEGTRYDYRFANGQTLSVEIL
ncbi:hypothetical protein [Burkholderia stagnalis]|uniref:hypothetical protein n=1 Tax=Burkholderia stagnalis TaxID=1503054 RepID=UPI000F5BCFAA|nr:hypothetical protein [Burkholderia stagnalis]